MDLVTETTFADSMQAAFGGQLQRQASLARYTAARLGGPADWLLVANTADQLADLVTRLWEMEAPFVVLGGGSNVLVSDAGVREVVVINRARQVRFEAKAQPPYVWAESGANFGALARQSASLGLAGLEWAAGVPGTVGGAVVGNAGAHGGDTAGNLALAEILHRVQCQPVREQWPVERLAYGYRSSLLKHHQDQMVVLAAAFHLENSTPECTQARIEQFTAARHRAQPAGASLGSIFKNPAGDYAGRLIDAAGLKGIRIGDAEISSLHANFFINLGQATAADYASLIALARRAVQEKFGILLELEIEMIGEW